MKYKLIFRSLLIFPFLLLIGCLPAPKNTPFNFNESDAIDFMDFLRNELHPDSVFTINESYPSWIKASDLQELINLLDSKERCASVASVYSSSLHGNSTVRDQAAFLIYGFRENKYPPMLVSRTISDQDVIELKAWWKTKESSSNRAGRLYFKKLSENKMLLKSIPVK